MRRFRVTLSLLVLTVVSSVIYLLFFSDTKVPDGGLEVLNIVALGLLLSGVALLIEFYKFSLWGRNVKSRDHQTFWQIIGALTIILVVYGVYYQLLT